MTRNEKHALTGNSHAVAPLQRVPYHGPIGYGDEGFWKVIWVGGESGQRHTGATQYYSLEARRRHAHSVRHPVSV